MSQCSWPRFEGNLLWGAAGTWRDVGHAGLRPGQGSPCVYRCLLLIKARSIWPVETNSLSFALFQKFLPCLKHDFFFLSSLSTLLLVVTQQTMPGNEMLHPQVKAAIKRRNCPQDRSISVNGEGDAK